MIEDLRETVFKTNPGEIDDSLRELMELNGKKILAMIVNVDGHWTTIHFNFEKRNL
jgi:hypothetical protein